MTALCENTVFSFKGPTSLTTFKEVRLSLKIRLFLEAHFFGSQPIFEVRLFQKVAYIIEDQCILNYFPKNIT